MNVRYPLKCNGCGSITVLRIGVSYRPEEPFAFTCQECGQDISGLHVTDQQRFEVVGIHDLSGAERTPNESGAKFYHQFHPDFPTDTQTRTSSGGLSSSPFLQAVQRRGTLGLATRTGRVLGFSAIIRENGNDIVRALRNAQGARWKQFDKDASQLGITTATPMDNVGRLCAVSRLVTLMFDPIFKGTVHADRARDADAMLRNLATTQPAEFEATLQALDSGGYLAPVRNQLLDIFARVVRVSDDLRPVLPEWDPDDVQAAWPAKLAAKGPQRFHDIKSLYVDAYETLALALTSVTALLNLRDRASADQYPVHPDLGNRFAPRNLAAFHRQSNSPKLAYLRGEQLFDPWVLPALDPKLRNAIGHYSAHYDPVAGTISYIVDKASGRREQLSYAEFLWGFLRIIFCCYETHEFLRALEALAQQPIRDPANMHSVSAC